MSHFSIKKNKITWLYLILFTLIFLFECGNPTSTEPDSRLFNAWIKVGYRHLFKDYNVVDQDYFNDDEIMEMDNFTKDTLAMYTRGYVDPWGVINYYDSTKVKEYAISVTNNTISGSNINTLNYDITSEGDLLGLTLSRTYQGVVNIGGMPQPTTVYSEYYLVKIDKDSLLADWPPVESMLE